MVQQTIPSFNWFNPTRVIFGVGELSRLGSVIDEVAGADARVFLVTGRSSLRARGILAPVIDSIGSSRVTLYDKVSPFPSPDQVDEALRECRAASAHIVVAIGGGSAMDLAKCVAILMNNEGSSREYAFGSKTFEKPGLPFIAGADYVWKQQRSDHWRRVMGYGSQKLGSCVQPYMFPTVAIVDPELTMTMPKLLAAATGFDAFTSAFESYWSVQAEPMSDAVALEVIGMFAKNLERSCIQGDLESRAACALAATMSGIGYSNSLPNICHAVGGPLTLFWDVEHGQSVGITLPAFLRWNSSAISHKMPALLNALGVSSLGEAEARLTQMLERCGLETRLSGLGLTEGDVGTLVDNIKWQLADRMPRALEKEDARVILQELF